MSEGVKNLIDAIASGDSLAIDAAFNSEMANRISERLDDMRIDVAQNMFRTESVQEDLDEDLDEELEQTDEGVISNIGNKVAAAYHTNRANAHNKKANKALASHDTDSNFAKKVKYHGAQQTAHKDMANMHKEESESFEE